MYDSLPFPVTFFFVEDVQSQLVAIAVGEDNFFGPLPGFLVPGHALLVHEFAQGLEAEYL